MSGQQVGYTRVSSLDQSRQDLGDQECRRTRRRDGTGFVSGDHVLLQAGAARAWSQSRNPLGGAGFRGLVEEYARQVPTAEGPLNELSEPDQ